MSLELLFPSPKLLSLLCFLFVVVVKIHPTLTDFSSDLRRSCRIPFRCGNITASFPFSGGDRENACGHPNLNLNCENDITSLMIDVKYRVLNIDQEKKLIRITRQIYFDGFCPQRNFTIDSKLFDHSAGYETLTLISGCPSTSGNSICNLDDIDYTNGFLKTGSPGCNSSVTVQVSENLLSAAKSSLAGLKEALKTGFELKWKLNSCKNCSSCAYDLVTNEEQCLCPDDQLGNLTGCTISQKPKGSSSNKIRDISIASVAGTIVILAIILIIAVGRHWKKKTEHDQNAEAAFIINYGSLAPKRFNYSDIKKMTKSFSDKLGQGGYGDVYKGKLPDGRLVAVKVLKNLKGNGEEFINEVASISRTSHVNVVTFVGFCYEKKKRALIYEFMPNGSLDQFIYDQESSSTNRRLEWRTIYLIAVGIARGLDYLHRGCNIRIVHLDIKPHNILLDEDFCPKISDFGLSKQWEKKESSMSMLDARGTIGYIAPELFCRNFGGVSHKSDVYSYGMMIHEMVIGRKNADVKVSGSSDYLPSTIYKHMEQGYDFQLVGVATEEEKEMANKMILVSLWCIQTQPSDRPSMTKVVEMLEGSIEHLRFPPKPSLASPSRSAISSYPTSFSTQFAPQEESIIARDLISIEVPLRPALPKSSPQQHHHKDISSTDAAIHINDMVKGLERKHACGILCI